MTRGARQQAADFISEVYAALLGNCTWQSFLDNLSGTLPNGKTTLFYHDLAARSGAFSLHSQFEPERIAAYKDYYSSRNPWMARAAARPLDLGVRAEQMLPRERLLRTEFYADFLQPQGLNSAVGVTILRDSGCNFMLSTTFGEADDTEVDAAAQTMGALAPHLRQAFSFYRRAGLAAGACGIVTAASEALGVGIVALGSGKRLRWANAVGQQLIAVGDLIGIDARGRIRSPRAEVREVLDAALALAMRGGSAVKRAVTIPASHTSTLPARVTFVVPTLASFEQYFAGPCVVLLIEKAVATPIPTEDDLRCAFAMTPSEARLARALAAGVTLADAAEAHRITKETARTQLKRVFAKMDVRRQAQLVAKIHRLGSGAVSGEVP